MRRTLPLWQTPLLAAALVAPLAHVPPAAAAAGSVTGTVERPSATGGSVPVAGALVTVMWDGGQSATVSSDNAGSYTVPGVPAGAYTVQVRDPRQFASYLPASVPGTMDAVELDTVDVPLDPDPAHALPWRACADDQDLGPCVESVSAKRNGQVVTAQPTDTVEYELTDLVGPEKLLFGGGSTAPHRRSVGWSFDGLGTEGTPLLLAALVQPPAAWREPVPLTATSRLVNHYLTLPHGQVLPQDVEFAIAVRGAGLQPKVVFGHMRGAAVRSETGSYVLAGTPLRRIDGPTDGPPTESEPIVERVMWFADVMADWRVACSNLAGSPFIMVTNSRYTAAPQVLEGSLRVTALGSHYDLDHETGTLITNDSGYYEVVLPKVFVEEPGCGGWERPLEMAEQSAHVTIETDGRRQRAPQEHREVRVHSGGGSELLVRVEGFHFSAPVITLSADAPASVSAQVADLREQEPAAGAQRVVELLADLDTTQLPLEQVTTVCLATAPGGTNPATAGEDYQPVTRGEHCIELVGGGKTQQRLPVTLLGGSAVESDETVLVQLLDGDDSAAPVLDTATLTITDRPRPVAAPAPVYVEPTAEPTVEPTVEPTAGPTSSPSTPAPSVPAPEVDPEPLPSPVAEVPAPATATPTTSAAPPTAPGLDLVDHSTTAGRPATVLVTGQPGQMIELVGYSRPSTTYRVLRRAVLDSRGEAPFALRPLGSTRLFARLVDQRDLATRSQVLEVRAAVSLTAAPSGTRSYRFAGQVLPALPGQRVVVDRLVPGGRVLTTVAVTDARGRWGVDRSFSGTGTHSFSARVGGSVDRAGGTSERLVLRLR